MAQPVKQNIAELHPELSEKQTYSLVIDGTNLLRLSFADTRINTSGVHYGGVFQFLLQIKILLQKKDFDYVKANCRENLYLATKKVYEYIKKRCIFSNLKGLFREIACPIPDCGLSGATTITLPKCFTAAIRFLIPGAVIPSSLVTNITFSYVIIYIC